MTSFGSELKLVRRKAKKTLADLGDAVGWSGGYVSLVECGHRKPPSISVIKTWLTMCNALDRLDEFEELANVFTALNTKKLTLNYDKNNAETIRIVTALATRCSKNSLTPEQLRGIQKILRIRTTCPA